MPTSEAQKRATTKYQAKTYDKMTFRFHKGKKDIIETHAATYDKSVNSFVNRAIDETIERDKKKMNRFS